MGRSSLRPLRWAPWPRQEVHVAETGGAPMIVRSVGWFPNHESRPIVSVVMPCRNEEALIASSLDSVEANDFPMDQVESLVVDDGSNDHTREILSNIARRCSNIRLISNPSRGTASALNVGVLASQGSVVIRMDAHSTYPSNYIALLVGALTQYGADNVGGVWEIRPRTATPIGRAIALSLGHRFGVGNSTYRIGAASPTEVDTVPFGCWPREVFDRIGLFDERLTRNQDLDFNHRLRKAGGRIVLLPSLSITYYCRSGFWETWQHNAANGYWVTYGWLLTGSKFSWRHMIPGLSVCFLVAGLIAALALSIWPLLVAVFIYITLLGFATLQIGQRSGDWEAAIRLPVVFSALHVSYGVGSLNGLLHGVWLRMKRIIASVRRGPLRR